MKKYCILILVIVLGSISIICANVNENNRSVAVFSYNDDYKIDINTANIGELMQLPEIGVGLARRIVAYREKHPFTQISEIKNVKGLGQSVYKQIENLITV